jgi:hypothetical protein
MATFSFCLEFIFTFGRGAIRFYRIAFVVIEKFVSAEVRSVEFFQGTIVRVYCCSKEHNLLSKFKFSIFSLD